MFGVCGAETSRQKGFYRGTRLEQKTAELAFYGLTAPSPVATCLLFLANSLPSKICRLPCYALLSHGHRTVFVLGVCDINR